MQRLLIPPRAAGIDRAARSGARLLSQSEIWVRFLWWQEAMSLRATIRRPGRAPLGA